VAEETGGKWLGRKPKGQQDVHSWKAFLEKTPNKVLYGHLKRHHRGMKPKEVTDG
jgi:hypothetical protein